MSCITSLQLFSNYGSMANLNFKGSLYDFSLGSMPISASALPNHVQDLLAKLKDFMQEYVYPNESIFEEHQKSDDCWQPHPLMEELKVFTVFSKILKIFT